MLYLAIHEIKYIVSQELHIKTITRNQFVILKFNPALLKLSHSYCGCLSNQGNTVIDDHT
jgi:hypothetical protein